MEEKEILESCKPDDDPLYLVVEQQPTFKCEFAYPDCSQDELNRFIFENLVYPHAARINKVQGTVHVSFVIEKSGCISGKQILKRLGYGCDEEALRVVGLMPAWIPGKQNGLPQRVRVVLPIKFNF